jgi:hypothetical protein
MILSLPHIVVIQSSCTSESRERLRCICRHHIQELLMLIEFGSLLEPRTWLSDEIVSSMDCVRWRASVCMFRTSSWYNCFWSSQMVSTVSDNISRIVVRDGRLHLNLHGFNVFRNMKSSRISFFWTRHRDLVSLAQLSTSWHSIWTSWHLRVLQMGVNLSGTSNVWTLPAECTYVYSRYVWLYYWG